MSDEPKPCPNPCDIETRIAVLETSTAHSVRMFENRAKASDLAVEVALRTLDKRLDSMNEFRSALNDSVTRAIPRAEADAEFRAIHGKLAASGKPNYLLATSLASVLFVLVAAGWFIVGLKIDNSLSPITVKLQAFAISQEAQDMRMSGLADRMRAIESEHASLSAFTEQSRVDRGQINERLKQMEMENHTHEERDVKTRGDIGIFFQRTNDRQEAIWRKVFGTPLPP